jgi:hypothetical protein
MIMAIRKSISTPIFQQIPQSFKSLHDELCCRGAKWLVSVQRCAVSLTEVGARDVPEMPDVIGWHPDGRCIVLEAKASRSDFLADRNKAHRATGMGGQRYFICPDAMVTAEELPDDWGLLFLKGERILVAKLAPYRQSNLEAERLLMLSCLKFPTKLQTKARWFGEEAAA